VTDQRPGRPASPPQQGTSPQGSASPQTPWRTVHRRKNTSFLFAEDIGPSGTTIDLEIIDSGIGEVVDVDGKTPMPWIAFKGARKRLGLNRTNSKRIETLCGTNIVERWRGWVTLVVIRSSYTDRKTKERWTTDAIKLAPERPRNPRKGMYITEAPLPAEPPADAGGAAPEPVFTEEALGPDSPMTPAEIAEIERLERLEGKA
jgi:hypothetical protein